MERKHTLRLYRLQGKLLQTVERLDSLKALNVQLLELTDSVAARHAYDFNIILSSKAAAAAKDLLAELEQITKETEGDEQLPF